MSMEYPRVNLLHKSEQRFQGAVSHKFIVVSLLVTPLLLISVFGGIQFVQRKWLETNLQISREIWTDLQPRLAFVQEEKRGLQTNRQALDLFNSWTESKLDPVDLLAEIQNIVPANIQLSKVSINAASDTAVYRTKKDLQPMYTLTMEGVSQGALAENAVIQLRKDLLKNDRIRATFETINLASLRKRQSPDGAAMREFRLIGKGMDGGAE